MRIRPQKPLIVTLAIASAWALLLREPAAHAAGNAPSPADQRQLLALSAAESAELRAGMRGFLESIEGIVSAMTANSMPKVAESAGRSGMAMISAVSVATAIKLPPDFVIMSTDTHQKFDELAKAALTAGSKLVVMQHLAGILANCTSCHAMYRVAQQ